MVHLSKVQSPTPTASESTTGTSTPVDSITKALSKVRLELADSDDSYTTTVYGSRAAGRELPRHEIPEDELPRDIAYRLIKDDLSLDGNPMLNLASFVTTYMEDEAEKLMAEAFSKNFIDYEEYPQTADIHSRCVNMISHMLHGDSQSVGTSCVGSSEAIMLAVLAMKRRWKNRRIQEGKPYDKPNLIMSSAVQVCWEKAVRYFEVDERYVYCTRNRFVIDPEETVKLVDENTIGICAIMGTTYTGAYEDVKAINDLLVEKNLDTPIHVDAASGGFVAPFVTPGLEWDFRLPKVVSINVSGHKYGLVYPGVGWVVWRSSEYLPQELVFNINYLGAEQSSFTLNFSKGASHIIGQYYQLIRLGKKGYRSIMSNLTRTADYLASSLQTLGFVILSEGGGLSLPLVAFRLPDQPFDVASSSSDTTKHRFYDEFALANQLRMRGWIVPAYTMAPKTDQMKMLRIVVREDFTRPRCDKLVDDIKLCMGLLSQLDKDSMTNMRTFLVQQRWSSHRHHHEKNTPRKYKGESHSLQGTTGKTHGIC
ncbi:hypothetical protein BROUX41_005355 [Berkeleyomyces rouxiae]